MLIPWQDLEQETLINIVDSFILREGTDYGVEEYSLTEKRQQLLDGIKQGRVVIVWSELHESIDLKSKDEFLK
ncbi:hypothetical protein EDC44_1048 [Cricetibacter osteomyelitidis]|uniref:Uncharacterized protein n=1 Tax=Cricetibacter osteomyelitidis TaxID=1521931 RepID=A0A4R2T3A9_9PAST|nr:YheU family protein [Cricetibacter osteomyelitidis]TCP96475.1 hypothetical protein EDC44_1048 [Cricetibacter osteomyelitidis]